MKKIFFATALLSLVAVSCNKTKTNETNKQTEETISYKGTDGTRANVLLVNSSTENTMTIRANNQKFQLDKVSDSVYERNGVKAEIKGDSLFILQDDTVIPLVKDL